MYYHPDGKPHVMVQDAEFKIPRNRHYPMTEAYSDGGPVLNDASQLLTGYVWYLYLVGDDVTIKREDLDASEVLFTKPNITQIDLTFDQNMRPFVCYVSDGLPYYYHFNAEDSSYSEVALDPTIKFPRCSLDMVEAYNIPNSDIILGYTREGNLCYRIQRERYGVERVIATDPNKLLLWRVGRTVDGRFGYQWR